MRAGQSGARVAAVSPFVTAHSTLLTAREDWSCVASNTAHPKYYGLEEIVFSDEKP